jgi:rare lipoprotein A
MKTRQISGLFALLLFILFMCAGCQSILQAQKRTDINQLAENQEERIARYAAPDGAAGIARCYAKRYSGRRTSSGEIYNPKRLTAAHPIIPLGTRVKVINLANNKSVIVKVNDRCREHEEAFIDLSREAARKLGIIRQGKANVRIIIIEDDDPSSGGSAAEKE